LPELPAQSEHVVCGSERLPNNRGFMSSRPSFSDSQLDQIFRAAKPLNPAERAAFLEDLASELRQAPHLGDGALYRTLRDLQRRYYTPPEVEIGTRPKWR
jgi:hypothetical protein